mmetsp:Transcript_36270/g.77355  ORF Transcript_36270/g.77355 Transcript_36270/m.77355 type:complete len:85 (+) Transcript_36270:669-923(+)
MRIVSACRCDCSLINMVHETRGCIKVKIAALIQPAKVLTREWWLVFPPHILKYSSRLINHSMGRLLRHSIFDCHTKAHASSTQL